MRDQHGLLTEADATRQLALMNFNDVRAAAVDLWRNNGVVGADFDGNNLSLLRDGKWGPKLHRDMNRALERHIYNGHRDTSDTSTCAPEIEPCKT